MLDLVLASTSPPRKLALTRLQLPFITVAPDVDETPKANESATAMVKRLAQLKAESIAAAYPKALIIAGDQVAEVNDEPMGKPKDHTDAVRQLLKSSDNTVNFYHGLCLLNTATGHLQLAVEITRVIFRPITQERIEAYLRRDKPYNCAGSLMAESLGVALIDRIETQDPHSLFGLPLLHLIKMLEKTGVDILTYTDYTYTNC